MDFVRFERGDDGVAVLTIDRQDKLNALNPQVVEELAQALLELDADPPRAIIVTGVGSRDFIVGADIAVMSDIITNESKWMIEI